MRRQLGFQMTTKKEKEYNIFENQFCPLGS